MIMQTNPGVIQQYEKRKAEVISVTFVILRRVLSHVQIAKLTQALNDREEIGQQLEREIGSARVRIFFIQLTKWGF